MPVLVVATWYQTAWFKILMACTAIVCILTLVQVDERTAELEQSKPRIEEIACHDALTGLPNRRLFTSDIGKLVTARQRNAGRFALLLIDLDRFKQINDTLGHDAGDALLVEGAKRLQSALRSSDRIARLGGDEFAILLDDLPDAASERSIIEAIRLRVLDSFSDPISYKDVEMQTSASIGVAPYPQHATGTEGLYKAADVALYEAKHDGRNMWRWSRIEDPVASLA